MSRPAANRLRHAWMWLILLLVAWLLPIAVLFGPVLLTQRGFAFRDAAHYYPPLLQVIHRQWPRQLPLWNALEERGRPLWADPTAAVLYPGQLIFALPCPFATAYKWYIVSHVLLCGATSWVAARRLRLNWHAAALASISYTLGGSIIFQYCNLPYLISAAWLPLGASAALGVVSGRNRWAPIELTAVLVLLVLGGDPQMAYLLGVTSVLAAVLAVWPLCRQLGWRTTWRPLANILGRLGLAGALAAGITAAQWMPTLAWAAESERATGDASAGAVQSPSRTTHDLARYEFSIGPWRWMELLWPNVSGRLFPRNERWIRIIPAEGRTWAPSLYLGILPLMLACQALRLRGGRLADRWLTWLVMLGIFGSLGRYGLGWMLSELTHGWKASNRLVPDEVSGLYWCLTVMLPGFHLFRYPAKLWTWAALGLSLLAGIRLQDATAQQQPAIPRRWLKSYAWLSVLLIAAIMGLGHWIDALWSTAPADALFGPLSVDSTRLHLVESLLQGLFVSVLALALLPSKVGPRPGTSSPPLESESKPRPHHFGWTIAIITALDLTVASRWMVATVDPSKALLRPKLPVAETAQGPGERPLIARFTSGTWYPEAWAQSSGDNRLEESVAWDSSTARAKYPMLYGLSTLQGSTSFSSRDHQALIALIDDRRRHDQSHWEALLRQLGVDFVCGRTGRFAGRRGQAAVTIHPSWPRDARYWDLPDSMPRAWIVHESVALASPAGSPAAVLERHLREVFLPDGQPRDLSRQVVLSPADSESAFPTAPTQSREREEFHRAPQRNSRADCRVEEVDAATLRIQVETFRAGWLVVNESYDSGWRAFIRSADSVRTAPVLRANYVMRAIALPPGEHEVTLVYDPPSVRRGLWVSGLSLVGAIVLGVLSHFARQQRQARGSQMR